MNLLFFSISIWNVATTISTETRLLACGHRCAGRITAETTTNHRFQRTHFSLRHTIHILKAMMILSCLGHLRPYPYTVTACKSYSSPLYLPCTRSVIDFILISQKSLSSYLISYVHFIHNYIPIEWYLGRLAMLFLLSVIILGLVHPMSLWRSSGGYSRFRLPRYRSLICKSKMSQRSPLYTHAIRSWSIQPSSPLDNACLLAVSGYIVVAHFFVFSRTFWHFVWFRLVKQPTCASEHSIMFST
jgi:hypothetical protein